MKYIDKYLKASSEISLQIDQQRILEVVVALGRLREQNGRLFILGVGGSAGNAGHAVNDFRKICNIESYAPTDNVSELTARVNDEGWASVFRNWLLVSNLNSKDALLILSVGGGDSERKISQNIIEAIQLADERGAMTIGIVGKSHGYTAQNADIAIVIPEIEPEMITPLSESFQSIVWHLIATHPDLKLTQTMWESQKISTEK
jgi:D-sedoheptulose 7-phosphate isomerase